MEFDMDRARSDMDREQREDARLIMLKALAQQVDETLHSDYLLQEVRRFGLRKDRGWVHDELRWMAERGVIRLMEPGTVLVAILLDKGARHLSREIAVEGIKRPSRGG